MLLDAERLAAPLMDGLPRHAHDEAMAAWPTDPVALLPPLPRDLVGCHLVTGKACSMPTDPGFASSHAAGRWRAEAVMRCCL